MADIIDIHSKVSSQKREKVVSAEEAVRVIRDGDVIATEGFVGAGFAEEIAIALEERFLKTGTPRNVSIIYAAGQGDGAAAKRGLNHLAIDGLVGRVVGGHIGLAPKLQKLIKDNKILAYNWPQGVVSHFFREVAAKRPGVISRIGLGTYIDPRNDGGKLNDKTFREGADLVRLLEIDGEEYMFYKSFPINVAFIRGTTGDTDGNITMEKEALTLEALAIAMAVKNSGGTVIVQVERVAERHSLNSRNVKIPGIMVDYVVVSRPENHWQTFAIQYDPSLSGEAKKPMKYVPPMEMSPRKIIARRAALELRPNSIVNLGIGMPEGVANVANEEDILNSLVMTAEPGVIGGMPNGGLNFGTGTNTDCLIDQPYQFDFYDGGGLDVAFLGAAEIDKEGNINVSKFGPRFVGPGGFINISQTTKEIVFVGTFTAGGLKVSITDGKLTILEEGCERKFLDHVEQVTFSGKYAAAAKKPVLYITERCVFSLVEEGLELIEIAPGIDLEKDILANMGFRPVMKTPPKLMDARIFKEGVMGLKKDLVAIPLEKRLIYNARNNSFYVNFANYNIRTSEEIQKIKDQIEKILAPLGRKVPTIVNYDNFNIAPELTNEYADMLKYVMQFYSNVTRYTTSAFLLMKLGDELQKRDVDAQMFDSIEEAKKALEDLER
jgi:propionate CoA-transferase